MCFCWQLEKKNRITPALLYQTSLKNEVTATHLSPPYMSCQLCKSLRKSYSGWSSSSTSHKTTQSQRLFGNGAGTEVIHLSVIHRDSLGNNIGKWP